MLSGVARRAPVALASLALCVLVASCGGGESSNSSERAPSGEREGTGASRLRVVALGDSETSGEGDPTGVGWVGRYARLLRSEPGLQVDVSNLAQNGKTSADLLADLRSDADTRTAVKNSHIVLFGIGGADLNAGDDNFAAGTCRAERCYAPVLRSFARNFDAIVGAVRDLRGSNKTVLRSITQPNGLTGAEEVIPPFLKPIATRIGVYQARTANRAICRGMAKYDGRCIDVLSAFNGPTGRADAYKKGLMNHEQCCYPSAKGQQLMAELLFKTGLAPIR
jgi:lysophospholipase L1-like esterase